MSNGWRHGCFGVMAIKVVPVRGDSGRFSFDLTDGTVCCCALQATGWRWRGVPSPTAGGDDWWPRHKTTRRRRRTAPSQVRCMTAMWLSDGRPSIHSQTADFFSYLTIAAASSCSIYEDSEWSQSLARALTLLILCLSRACDRESCEFVAALALENMQSVSSNAVYFCAFQQYFQWAELTVWRWKGSVHTISPYTCDMK